MIRPLCVLRSMWRALGLATGLAASPAAACTLMAPDGGAVILGTHHVNATDDFDEGLGLRGLTLNWDCQSVETSFAVFRNSFGNLGTGVSARFTDWRLGNDTLSLSPVVGLNWYPEEETARLRRSNGFFPLAGVQTTLDLGRSDLWLSWYPAYKSKDVGSFDSLLVAGISWDW